MGVEVGFRGAPRPPAALRAPDAAWSPATIRGYHRGRAPRNKELRFSPDQREGEIALRDHALAVRDAAVAARHDAVYQRDALSRTSERLQSELSGVVSDRGAALVMRRAARERAVSRRNTLLPVAILSLIVLVVAVVLLVVLGVL